MNSSLTTQIGNGDNSLAGDFENDSYGIDPFGVENMEYEYDNTNGYDSYGEGSDGRYDDRQQEYDSQSGSDDGEYGGGRAPTQKELKRQVGWHGRQPPGLGMGQIEQLNRLANADSRPLVEVMMWSPGASGLVSSADGGSAWSSAPTSGATSPRPGKGKKMKNPDAVALAKARAKKRKKAKLLESGGGGGFKKGMAEI